MLTQLVYLSPARSLFLLSSQDYTSAACQCFTADALKLYQRLLDAEGSGGTGLVLTLIAYLFFMLLAALALYQYLVVVHKDGHLLDLWRRINAPNEEFFCPHDFEVTHEELMSICQAASQYRGSIFLSLCLSISLFLSSSVSLALSFSLSQESMVSLVV